MLVLTIQNHEDVLGWNNQLGVAEGSEMFMTPLNSYAAHQCGTTIKEGDMRPGTII